MLPMQNALNLLMSDMLVSAEYTAFPQRWVTGLGIQSVDTGKPVQPFKLAYDRMLMARDKDVRFGQLDAADLAPYIRAIEACIQHIASTTRTPPHYLLGQAGSFPSGESLKATETGLVAKVKRRQGDFGESWEECVSVAFRAAGDARRADRQDKEAVWADPEVPHERRTSTPCSSSSRSACRSADSGRTPGYSPQLIAKWKDAAAAAARRGARSTPRCLATRAMAQVRATIADAPSAPSPSRGSRPRPPRRRPGRRPSPDARVRHGR
jgi:hypothetical protein